MDRKKQKLRTYSKELIDHLRELSFVLQASCSRGPMLNIKEDKQRDRIVEH